MKIEMIKITNQLKQSSINFKHQHDTSLKTAGPFQAAQIHGICRLTVLVKNQMDALFFERFFQQLWDENPENHHSRENYLFCMRDSMIISDLYQRFLFPMVKLAALVSIKALRTCSHRGGSKGGVLAKPKTTLQNFPKSHNKNCHPSSESVVSTPVQFTKPGHVDVHHQTGGVSMIFLGPLGFVLSQSYGCILHYEEKGEEAVEMPKRNMEAFHSSCEWYC